MKRLSVKDVFTEGFVSVNENDSLSSCLPHFKEKITPALVVLDDRGKYKGIITQRWIIRSRLDPSKTKVKSLMRRAPVISPQESLSKVARLMLESGARQLPVYRGKRLLGFVTDEEIIHQVVIEEWGNKQVEEIMTDNPFVVEENESVGALLSLFRQEGISHAPIVKDGKLVGMASVHDIIEHIYQPKRRLTSGDIVGEKVPVLSIPVKGIMTKPVTTILRETRLKDAEKKMRDFDISSLVVVQKGRPIGILTKRDLLEPLAQIEKPDRRLVVQFSVKDVEVDEIRRGFMIDDFESFARKYRQMLESGTLFVYMKTHGTNIKGDQLIHCRLQLRTVKGSFFSSAEGWGVEQTFRVALDRLERRLVKSKEVNYDPEFVRKYLRRIRFPMTDL